MEGVIMIQPPIINERTGKGRARFGHYERQKAVIPKLTYLPPPDEAKALAESMRRQGLISYPVNVTQPTN